MDLVLLLLVLAGPALVILAASWVFSYRCGRDKRLALALGGPLLLLFLTASVLPHLWDPQPGCVEECWGRLIYGVWLVSGAITLELGVFFGWLQRRLVRGRLASHNPPA
jgi:hypothetical protein